MRVTSRSVERFSGSVVQSIGETVARLSRSRKMKNVDAANVDAESVDAVNTDA